MRVFGAGNFKGVNEANRTGATPTSCEDVLFVVTRGNGLRLAEEEEDEDEDEEFVCFPWPLVGKRKWTLSHLSFVPCSSSLVIYTQDLAHQVQP